MWPGGFRVECAASWNVSSSKFLSTVESSLEHETCMYKRLRVYTRGVPEYMATMTGTGH